MYIHFLEVKNRLLFFFWNKINKILILRTQCYYYPQLTPFVIAPCPIMLNIIGKKFVPYKCQTVDRAYNNNKLWQVDTIDESSNGIPKRPLMKLPEKSHWAYQLPKNSKGFEWKLFEWINIKIFHDIWMKLNKNSQCNTKEIKIVEYTYWYGNTGCGVFKRGVQN